VAVIRLWFGIGGGLPLTAARTGERLGLPRQRVGEVEAAALARLRDLAGGRSPATGTDGTLPPTATA
jgi:DNA-directed RNA polymerase sigma subunit (sigma70/sigma32)